MLKTAGSRTLAVVAAVGLAGSLFVSTADAGKSKRRTVKPEEQLAFGVDMAKRGLWNEALFRFKRAAELSPGNSRIFNNLAVSYEAVGQFDAAMEHYKKALQMAPGNTEVKKNYARFVEFYQGFRPPEPEKEQEPAAPIDPEDTTPSDVLDEEDGGDDGGAQVPDFDLVLVGQR